MVITIKKNLPAILTFLLTIGVLIFLYACEPKTASLINTGKRINRQELQLELDQLISLAQLRMVDLDKQEQFKAVILQNALILVAGQPLNPIGLLTGIAAIYGLSQGSYQIGKKVKTVANKRKVNNGHT